jgi:hypothetical protein
MPQTTQCSHGVSIHQPPRDSGSMPPEKRQTGTTATTATTATATPGPAAEALHTCRRPRRLGRIPAERGRRLWVGFDPIPRRWMGQRHRDCQGRPACVGSARGADKGAGGRNELWLGRLCDDLHVHCGAGCGWGWGHPGVAVESDPVVFVHTVFVVHAVVVDRIHPLARDDIPLRRHRIRGAAVAAST